MRFAILAAALLSAVGLCGSARAMTDRVVATVDGTQILSSEVDMRVRDDDQLRLMPGDPVALRLEALRQLCIEVAAEHAVRAWVVPGSAFKYELDKVRRQHIVEVYAGSAGSALKVEPREIDAFIGSNPQFFSQRKTWHYHEVVVRASNEVASRALRAHADQISAVGDIPSSQIGARFAWVADRSYDAVIVNHWLGAEEIASDILDVLGKLEKGRDKVHVDCQGASCSFIVFHEAYDDPVDPAFMRNVIENNLLGQKRAQNEANVHDQLFRHAQIKFQDPALADLAAKVWKRPQYLSATSVQKVLWTAQITLAVNALAWALWLFSTGGDDPEQLTFRQKRATALDGRLHALLYGKATQRVLTLVVAVPVLGEVLWALTATEFVKFDHDFALVLGGCLIVTIALIAAWRFAPVIRRLAGTRRLVVPGIYATTGVLTLTTLAVI